MVRFVGFSRGEDARGASGELVYDGDVDDV